MKPLFITIFILSLSLLSSCGNNLLGDESYINNQSGTTSGPTNITLSLSSGAYRYSNGTYSINCLEYLNSASYSAEGSGNYWLDPDAAGPGIAFQAYCDMTTDGGGWTLIGRGREDWAWNNAGSNTSNVYQNVGTTAAFTPAYYSSTVVDDIINNINVSSLTNGLRIKRSLDTTGTSYQEVRWHFNALGGFSWTFDAIYPLNDVVVGGASFGAADSRDNAAAHGNDVNRIFTWAWGSHASKVGFSYGNTITAGTNSPTNFLWENGAEGHSIPYSEVYVRE